MMCDHSDVIIKYVFVMGLLALSLKLNWGNFSLLYYSIIFYLLHLLYATFSFL